MLLGWSFCWWLTVLFAPSASALRRMLSICVSYATSHGLVFKTQLICFHSYIYVYRLYRHHYHLKSVANSRLMPKKKAQSPKKNAQSAASSSSSTKEPCCVCLQSITLNKDEHLFCSGDCQQHPHRYCAGAASSATRN